MQRLGTAEEVAETVVFMLSDKPGFMTGTLVSIDGGYVAG
ncbi:SDR family oxidoreductase [Patescibacteria group bacterium]|nr:SDR family oxidoreductase [Patescibacteria group bacterium]